MKQAAICFLLVFIGGIVILALDGYKKSAGNASGAVTIAALGESEVCNFMLPYDWNVIAERPHGKGWVQTGKIPYGFEAAQVAVEALMAGSGYVRKHCVGGGVDDVHALVQYESSSGRVKVIWSLRRSGVLCTNFSWGWSK